MSPGTGRRSPLTMLCATLRVPRSAVYLALAPPPRVSVGARKRGPKTTTRDAEERRQHYHPPAAVAPLVGPTPVT